MIKCSDVDNFLDDYLDGSLPEETRKVFEQHLSHCPPCQVYLGGYRNVARMARTAVQAGSDGSEDVMPQALLDAILAAQKTKP